MLPSGLSDVIADEEDLARFLTSSSHFSKTMVKPSAFVPNPTTNDTSVFRHGREPRAALWALAEEHVVGRRNLHGVAVISARDVRAAGLDVVPHEPPPTHANIIGWPSSNIDPEMAKAEQKERAILIARHAQVIPR